MQKLSHHVFLCKWIMLPLYSWQLSVSTYRNSPLDPVNL
uniref:Uncharacterized protein n=1 Tax=Podoviridae sp. ctZkC8 TaxID=2825259 RepID=A0A8S5UBL4_9CAUD|nr:MAG TPA: hypothetical protein [Podoviridae sp. ctZkC8]